MKQIHSASRLIAVLFTAIVISGVASTHPTAHATLMSATSYQGADVSWSVSLPANSSPNNSFLVTDSARDKNGDIYLVGRLDGTLDLDPGAGVVSVTGGARAAIVKYSSTGAYVWHMVTGGTNARWNSIAFEPDGESWWVVGNTTGMNNASSYDYNPRGPALILGSFVISRNDMIVARYDLDGRVIASTAFKVQNSSGSTFAFGVAASTTGVHIAGDYWSSSSSPTNFNPLGTAVTQVGARVSGGADAYVAKYSLAGELEWIRSFGSSTSNNREIGRHVGIDSSGNVYTSGNFSTNTNYDLGGGAINFGTQRHYLAKFNSSGTHQWSFRFAGTDTGSYDRVEGFEVAPNGTIYVGGSQSGTFDFRGTSGTAVSIVAQTNAYSGYLAAFNTNGAYQWHVLLRHVAHPSGTTQHLSKFLGMSVASDGSVYTAGMYRGTMDFDGTAGEYLLTPTTDSCSRDRFLAKYTSSGALLWAVRPGSICDTTTTSNTNVPEWSGSPIAMGSSVVVAYRPHQNPGLLLAQYGPDTTAPLAPVAPDLVSSSDLGVSSTDNVTSRNTPTISVVARENGGTVTVRASRGGVTEQCTMTGSTSGGTCVLPVLSDGDWVINAVHEDLSGNISPTSSSLTITIDTVVPSLSSVSPTHASTGVSTTATFGTTYSENIFKRSGSLTLLKGAGCATTVETVTVSSSRVVVTADNFSLAPANPYEFLTAYCVTYPAGLFQDLAGNQTPAMTVSSVGRITFTSENDAIPPTAAITAPASPATSRTLVYAVTFDEFVTGVASSDFSNTGTATCTFAVPTSSGTSFSVTATCTSDGTVVLRLAPNSVTDAASNTGPTSAVVASTVVIDTTGGATTTTAPTQTSTTVASVSSVAPGGTTLPPVGSGPTTQATPTTLPTNSTTLPANVAVTSTTTTVPAPSTTTTTLPTVEVPEVGDDAGALVIGGQRVEATITRENNQLVIAAGVLRARISAVQREGGRAPLDSDGRIRMDQGDSIEIEVTGFGSESQVEVRMYSDPVLLGRSTVSALGNLMASYEVPESVDDGRHTVVLLGESQQGEELTFALAVFVGAESTGPSTLALLVGIPLGLAVIAALVIPAILRRRRKDE